MIVFLYLLSVLCLLLYLSISWAAKTLLSLFCLTVRPPAQLITFQPSHPTKPCLPYPLQYHPTIILYQNHPILLQYLILPPQPIIQSYLSIYQTIPTRVGNLLISFSSDSLVFCEQKRARAICLWKRANRSYCALKKSEWAKSDG